MTRTLTHRLVPVGLAALLATVGCGLAGCGSGGTKAGGAAPPVTLTMGTNDGPGRPSSEAIDEFARQVERLSDGRLRVRPVLEAAGTRLRDWDQRVAALVVHGDLDLAMIPARTWDTEGVTTLRAVQAPFLVTSDEHLDRVVTGEVANDLLAGLDGHGVVGLALVPEAMRHPFAFARPLLAPADYAGATIRTPRSDLGRAFFEALGARPDDLIGEEFDLAVAAGSVRAVDSEYVLAASLPAATVATGNVTFFPKVDTLVVNAEVLAALDAAQRDILRRAAAATTDWAIGSTPSDAEAASAYCRQGGTVVLAPAADVDALRRATAPVLAALERDPATAALIDAIGRLAPTATAAPVVRRCGSPPSGAVAVEGSHEVTPIDGVYRAELREDELLARGMAPLDAHDNAGLVRLTFDRGGLVMSEQRGDWPDCHAVYTVSGDRLEVLVTGPGCPREERPLIMRWALDGAALRLTPIDPTDPFTRVWWGGEPFKRVGDAASPDAVLPDGVYRRAVSEDELLAAGVLPDRAHHEAGIYTLELRHGAWSLHTESALGLPDCHGTYAIADGRVSLREGDCGEAELFTATPLAADGDLRFEDVRAVSLEVEVSFGGAPWAKIG